MPIDFLLVTTSHVLHLDTAEAGNVLPGWMIASQQWLHRGGEALLGQPAVSTALLLASSYRWANRDTVEWKQASGEIRVVAVVGLVGLALAAPTGFCVPNLVCAQGILKTIKSADLTNHQWELEEWWGEQFSGSLKWDCLRGGRNLYSKMAKRSSISREPRFVFFVRLKPHAREGNAVGIISRSGWYESKEKNNSSTLKQLISNCECGLFDLHLGANINEEVKAAYGFFSSFISH